MAPDCKILCVARFVQVKNPVEPTGVAIHRCQLPAHQRLVAGVLGPPLHPGIGRRFLPPLPGLLRGDIHHGAGDRGAQPARGQTARPVQHHGLGPPGLARVEQRGGGADDLRLVQPDDPVPQRRPGAGQLGLQGRRTGEHRQVRAARHHIQRQPGAERRRPAGRLARKDPRRPGLARPPAPGQRRDHGQRPGRPQPRPGRRGPGFGLSGLADPGDLPGRQLVLTGRRRPLRVRVLLRIERLILPAQGVQPGLALLLRHRVRPGDHRLPVGQARVGRPESAGSESAGSESAGSAARSGPGGVPGRSSSRPGSAGTGPGDMHHIRSGE